MSKTCGDCKFFFSDNNFKSDEEIEREINENWGSQGPHVEEGRCCVPLPIVCDDVNDGCTTSDTKAKNCECFKRKK